MEVLLGNSPGVQGNKALKAKANVFMNPMRRPIAQLAPRVPDINAKFNNLLIPSPEFGERHHGAFT